MAAPKADYGIDAPDVLRRFFLLATLAAVAGIVLQLAARRTASGLLFGLSFPCFSVAVSFFLTTAVMLWGSKFGKLRLRDRAIESIFWRGNERVLDVGCGRGLMLIGAAKHLTNGKAVGVDIWQSADQAGNRPEATRENARREGVAERIELADGDARALPFPNGAFDVVLSSFALHNIYDRAGRERALREIVRVLKPGGRLAIWDIRHAAEYAQSLEESGMVNVHRSGPNFSFLIPAHLLTAIKPERAA